MSGFRLLLVFVSVTIVLGTIPTGVLAQGYNPGVTVDQYVKFGNFVGIGPGFEAFNDYDWLKLEVVGVSGKEVRLLSTGQFKNGLPVPGNGSLGVWSVEAGTEDGVERTQGPIIAGGLRQGDAIPPPSTYTVNKTEDRVYLGIVRSVNILSVMISTPDYNTTLTYVYDRFSGMLMEAMTKTTQAQPETVTSEYSYNIIETNIFGQVLPGSIFVQLGTILVAVALIVVITVLVGLALRKKPKRR